MSQVNRNNNNNTTTANHNHNNHIHAPSTTCVHKPIITTLKPVEEAEGPYMKMDGSLEEWTGTSPKQIPSPMQEDYMEMNGPPGWCLSIVFNFLCIIRISK